MAENTAFASRTYFDMFLRSMYAAAQCYLDCNRCKKLEFISLLGGGLSKDSKFDFEPDSIALFPPGVVTGFCLSGDNVTSGFRRIGATERNGTADRIGSAD